MEPESLHFKPTRDAVLLIQNHTWRPQIGVSQLPRYWYCGSDNSLLWGAVLNIVGYCSILDLYSLDADSSALEFCAQLLRSCPTLCDLMDCSLPGPSVHGDSLGKTVGAGCHVLLQGIFPTQGLNPRLLHWQVDSLSLAPPGKPTVPQL